MRTIVTFGVLSYIVSNLNVGSLNDMNGGNFYVIFILVAMAQDIKELIKK